MAEMTKRERLEATIAGGEADRPAVALWRHFPVDDQYAGQLARSSVDFVRQFDFDFLKVTPSSSFCLDDWGVESTWRGNLEGTREYTRRVIRQPEDWTQLKLLDPRRGHLGEIILALELIGKDLAGEIPFIQTIFNPLSQARNLAGERMRNDMRQYPQEFKAGLETITASTTAFIEAARTKGIAGIFLAVQHASYDLMSEAEYLEFGRPYDLRLLEAARGLWLNVLHLHGNNVMFKLLADFPVQVINWHDQETPPSLMEALTLFPGALCGGLRQIDTMLQGTPLQVKSEARAALLATGGKRLILGTGCVTPIASPLGNIRAAREVVDE